MINSPTSPGYANAGSAATDRLSAPDNVLRQMQSNNERVAIQVQRLSDIRDRLLGSRPQNVQKDGPQGVPSGFFAQYNAEQMTLDRLLDVLTEMVSDLQNM
jgi:hypothetical protein